MLNSNYERKGKNYYFNFENLVAFLLLSSLVSYSVKKTSYPCFLRTEEGESASCSPIKRVGVFLPMMRQSKTSDHHS